MMVGSRVGVQYILDREGPPVLLTWQHDDTPASVLPGVSAALIGHFVQALVIEEVKPKHAVIYGCPLHPQASSLSF